MKAHVSRGTYSPRSDRTRFSYRPRKALIAEMRRAANLSGLSLSYLTELTVEAGWPIVTQQVAAPHERGKP